MLGLCFLGCGDRALSSCRVAKRTVAGNVTKHHFLRSTARQQTHRATSRGTRWPSAKLLRLQETSTSNSTKRSDQAAHHILRRCLYLNLTLPYTGGGVWATQRWDRLLVQIGYANIRPAQQSSELIRKIKLFLVIIV